MSQIDYYVGQSLDGCIATDDDDDLSWLISTEFGPEGYRRGHEEFFRGIGALPPG